MKATGAEINEFYNHGWPEGYHLEDMDESVDLYDDEQNLNLPPDEKFDLSLFGWLLNDSTNEDMTFSSAFRAWKKRQTTRVLVVVCDIANEDVVRAAVEAAGGNIK